MGICVAVETHSAKNDAANDHASEMDVIKISLVREIPNGHGQKNHALMSGVVEIVVVQEVPGDHGQKSHVVEIVAV